jgi:hypothetical protein
MHKGKLWRQARPRDNLPYSPYSERWPYRLQFWGEFDYNGVTLTIPAQTAWGKCTFDSAAVSWTNVNVFSIGLYNFTATAILARVDLPYRWNVDMAVTDGVGVGSTRWEVNELDWQPIIPGINYAFPASYFLERTGLFGPIVYLKFIPVFYPD